jgi:hypothetical protein
MINLQEFRQLVEEEKSDYSKFDMLVRAGLANKAQIARIHRILDKMTEERPQFNNADREIMRNLFNRMVDIISNNKQIFQKTRQVVREEINEAELDTADYKIGPSGRKVRAHRFKVGDAPVKEEYEIEEAALDLNNDPPFVLVLKRKSIRLYPNNTKIALYYNQKLDKYFSIPYGGGVDAPVQAEETQIEEGVMDQLHKIVADKQAQTVKFGNGQSRKVDHFTASAITQVHKALNDDNKKKFADMVHKSPAHLVKASDFAFSRAK